MKLINNEKIVRLLGDPENVPLSGRILHLILLVSFMIFATASMINLMLGDLLLLLETLISAAIFLFAYYLSVAKGQARVVSYIVPLLIIGLFISNWLINQGSYGPTAFFVPHMTVIIYFLLGGRVRTAVLLLFVVVTVSAFLYEYYNPGIVTPYNDALSRYTDLALSNIQGVVFLLLLLMYIQWNFEQDLIARQKMMHELEQANREAERANVAKSMFLANMSHEMRTPLNAINGFSHVLLRQHSDELEAVHLEYLKHINDNGVHLMALINNVLDISKIEADKMGIEEAPFVLSDAIQSAVTRAEALAEAKGLEFVFELSAQLPEVIVSDSVKINQILTNLLANAVKFTATGRITLVVAGEGGRLKMAVVDEGIGILPEQQESIFGEFEQADISTTRRYGGSGLGLSITRKLVQLLGGDISVRSQPGVGTTFEVLLPLVEGVVAEKTDTAAGVTISPDSKILLVEDNLLNQKIMTTFLGQMGLSATVAENGAVGLQMVEQERPDIVFMDIHMPVMDGIEASRLIREKYGSAIPVVALTADAFKDRREMASRSCFDDYLIKPITQEQLEIVLAKYLG